MIGLLVLGGVAAYVALWWFVISKARNRSERISAIVIALLIPFWDLPISYLKFIKLCSEEGGIHINKDFRPTNSILIAEGTGYRPENVLKLGFTTAEFVFREQIVRYSDDGKGIVKSSHTTPNSALKFQFLGQRMLPWRLTRTDYVVTRVDDGQVVARQTDFGWLGMWWEVALGIRFTSGNRCAGVWDRELLAALVTQR